VCCVESDQGLMEEKVRSTRAGTRANTYRESSCQSLVANSLDLPPFIGLSTLSQSTSMAIRMPPPRRILSSTPSSPSVTPDSPPSLRWNTSSFRENTSNVSTQRISSLSISPRPSYRSCETRHRTRATPSKMVGPRRSSSYVFPRSTGTSECHSWDRPQ